MVWLGNKKDNIVNTLIFGHYLLPGVQKTLSEKKQSIFDSNDVVSATTICGERFRLPAPLAYYQERPWFPAVCDCCR